MYSECFQFISVDGTRSPFDSSLYSDRKFTDHIVPQGKQIRTVFTILQKTDGLLRGFKWVCDDGTVLVAVGIMTNPNWEETSNDELTTLTLNPNQRLVGVKSYSGEFRLAIHLSF
jgi:hypothetical protein